MNYKELLKYSLIAAMLITPVAVQADMAREFCDNHEANLAKAVLDSDAIAWGQVLDSSEKTKREKNGRWVYSWKAKVKVSQVWMGKYEIGQVEFSGECSGTATTSRNHCSSPPAEKGAKLVIFLQKGTDGKLHLAQPKQGAHSGESCPGAAEIKKVRKQRPKVFKKVLEHSK